MRTDDRLLLPVQARPSARGAMDPSLSGSTVVVVGIDFSPACERALLEALTLAERAQATLALVHVFEWEVAGRLAPSVQVSAPPASSATSCELKKLVDAARGRLAQLCSSLVGDRVAAEIHVQVGNAARELCRATERASASLLVIGTRGRDGPDPATPGRTAERLLHSSRVPVLLVAAPG